MSMQTVLTPLDFADLLFRGGTIGILCLMIVHLAQRQMGGNISFVGILFCLTGVAEAALHAPALSAMVELPVRLMLPLQQLHFITLWWFVMALFNDRFEWDFPCIVPCLITMPLIAGAVMSTGTTALAFRVGLAVLNAGLLVMILRIALRDQATDLVDERRTFRRALAFSVPPFTVLVSIESLFSTWDQIHSPWCNVYSAVYFLLALGFSYWMTRINGNLVMRPDTEEASETGDRPISAADRLELGRITNAMTGGLYLEPGLTIGGLGDILRIPEHRLRRLVNRGLGYRNFAAFVNDYRIEEAKRRLADPTLAREQIIQHAFSLGYASLAPFNRAFRERVGVSPTEYRETALAAVAGQ